MKWHPFFFLYRRHLLQQNGEVKFGQTVLFYFSRLLPTYSPQRDRLKRIRNKDLTKNVNYNAHR
jgi:hypothetical protein